MRVSEDRTIFRKRAPLFSTLGVVVILVLVVINLVVLTTGDKIAARMSGTPLPTRTSNSYQLEGQALFQTGALEEAIGAYLDALEIDPDNPEVLMELARIYVYSSKLQTGSNILGVLLNAQETIDRAAELAPDSSDVMAVRALVYDWLGTNQNVPPEERESHLAEASKAATAALRLDPGNPLAIAFRAELLMDRGNFTQALQQAELAVEIEPNLMDTHRVYAYVLESTGNYSLAINEYQAAAEILPNLTFLYISIGQNYRQLELYDQALEYFDRAATINETIGIKDPLPYLAIAKTYARQGQFFAASRNADKALSFEPTNPDLYGQLGFINFQARNYEGSILMFECAVDGCEVLFDSVLGVIPLEDGSEEQRATLPREFISGLPLNDESVVYYYIYSSALAALDHCERAYPIFDELEAQYGDDEIIMAIVEENRVICEILSSENE